MSRYQARTRPASSTTRIRDLALSDMRRIQRALVDDGVTIAADLEQWRDAAHGFAVAQAQKAPGRQVLKQVFGGSAPGRVVKIDEHIAAENDIEAAMQARSSRLNKVGG